MTPARPGDVRGRMRLWSAVLGLVVGIVVGGMVILPMAENLPWVVAVAGLVGLLGGLLVGGRLDRRTRPGQPGRRDDR